MHGEQHANVVQRAAADAHLERQYFCHRENRVLDEIGRGQLFCRRGDSVCPARVSGPVRFARRVKEISAAARPADLRTLRKRGATAVARVQRCQGSGEAGRQSGAGRVRAGGYLLPLSSRKAFRSGF